MKGKVKWFQDEKGYGFIGAEDGRDVFVHFTAVVMSGRKTLKDGDAVEFEVEPSEKGPRAKNVTVLKDSFDK